MNRSRHVEGAWQNFCPNIEAFWCLWGSKILQVHTGSKFIKGSQLPALAMRRKPYIRCRSGRPRQQLFHLQVLQRMKCEASLWSLWSFQYHLITISLSCHYHFIILHAFFLIFLQFQRNIRWTWLYLMNNIEYPSIQLLTERPRKKSPHPKRKHSRCRSLRAWSSVPLRATKLRRDHEGQRPKAYRKTSKNAFVLWWSLIDFDSDSRHLRFLLLLTCPPHPLAFVYPLCATSILELGSTSSCLSVLNSLIFKTRMTPKVEAEKWRNRKTLRVSSKWSWTEYHSFNMRHGARCLISKELAHRGEASFEGSLGEEVLCRKFRQSMVNVSEWVNASIPVPVTKCSTQCFKMFRSVSRCLKSIVGCLLLALLQLVLDLNQSFMLQWLILWSVAESVWCC